MIFVDHRTGAQGSRRHNSPALVARQVEPHGTADLFTLYAKKTRTVVVVVDLVLLRPQALRGPALHAVGTWVVVATLLAVDQVLADQGGLGQTLVIALGPLRLARTALSVLGIDESVPDSPLGYAGLV